MGSVLSYWKKCFNKGKELGIKKKEEHKKIIKSKIKGDSNV